MGRAEIYFQLRIGAASTRFFRANRAHCGRENENIVNKTITSKHNKKNVVRARSGSGLSSASTNQQSNNSPRLEIDPATFRPALDSTPAPLYNHQQPYPNDPLLGKRPSRRATARPGAEGANGA